MPVLVRGCHLLDNLLFLIAASTTKMPYYARDLVGNLFILLFFCLGFRELKVGREYTVNVFNGLINV